MFNLKKLLKIGLACLVFILSSGFDADDFSIDHLDKYEKEFKVEEMETCFNVSAKTYMPYTAITKVESKQYKYIHEKMQIHESGLLYDEEGFIGAALASDFGSIGSRFYFTLESGIVLPIVKVDAKPDMYTNGCAANSGHIIEFVIDVEKANEFFGASGNGLVNYGNFNNDKRFEGVIVKIEKVLDERVNEGVSFVEKEEIMSIDNLEDTYNQDMYSGY